MQVLAIRPLADSALTLELAREVGLDASRRVAAAQAAIEAARVDGTLAGVTESAVAFCSITLHYDSAVVTQEALAAQLAELLAEVSPDALPEGRAWQLPCCYEGALAADLPDLEAALGIDRDEIVATHAGLRFFVYALGFLPGLPFLGDLPERLARPRRSEPRTSVPAGSVAIANRMCVIYPWNSPGGWHILGNCPVPLFDVARASPALLDAGDTVSFRPVPRAEYDALRAELASGALDPLSLREGP